MSKLSDETLELFELCKQVYEATGWNSDDLLHYLGGEVHYKHLFESDMHHLNTTKDTYSPLYTSDYLLEKLPRYIYLQQSADGKSWGASQLQPTELRTAENAYQSINTSAVTPLRALLLLTLKLHEEGLL